MSATHLLRSTVPAHSNLRVCRFGLFRKGARLIGRQSTCEADIRISTWATTSSLNPAIGRINDHAATAQLCRIRNAQMLAVQITTHPTLLSRNSGVRGRECISQFLVSDPYPAIRLLFRTKSSFLPGFLHRFLASFAFAVERKTLARHSAL
jgi:hypothetical protein